ncbi:MAG: glycosyltransferase family 4 protein [Patescibacteria group bacterium]|nr:glycosyltransferase family 4 protein [Patescibacteria group bacterium]
MVIGIDARLWSQTGIGRYTRNLVFNMLKLDELNEYVIFVQKKEEKEIKDQISKFKIKNLKLKIIAVDIKWHTISEQIKFASILNKEKLDLVHFPYFSVPIFYNRPFVVTIHDLIVHHFPTGKASTLALPLYKAKLIAYKIVIKKATQKAKRIITVSNSTKAEIIDHLKISEDKIEVIYEAFDDKLKIENLKFKIGKYGKYFLYVGNAYPHKNLERLIKAFSKISKDYKDLRLILIGKKDYFYQKLEKENKSDRIVFFGNATDDELSSFYSNAIALVAPSLMEGFGLPVLEAMSLRCLVIASDIPAFREIAQDEILYFDPKDVEDMSAKLKNVIENENKYKKEILDKAFEQTKNFSWEKSARETLKTYEEVLGIKK